MAMEGQIRCGAHQSVDAWGNRGVALKPTARAARHARDTRETEVELRIHEKAAKS